MNQEVEKAEDFQNRLRAAIGRSGGGQCHLTWKVLVFVCTSHSHRFSDPKQKAQV
jgi:hypothetical protein